MDDPRPLRQPYGTDDGWRRRPSRTRVVGATLVVLISIAGIAFYGGRGTMLGGLSAAQDATTSELRIQAVPAGARVFVDGKMVGAAPAWEGRVQGGVRWVEVVGPNEMVLLDTLMWVTAGTRAVVSAEEPERVGEMESAWQNAPDSVALEPIAAESGPIEATGDLRVSSTPSGAVVRVDGRRAGTTPFALDDLPSGTYTVTVERGGYEPARRQVDIRAGGVFDASVDLRPLAAAPRPAEPPRRTPPVEPPRRTVPAAPSPASTEPGIVEVLVRPWGRIVIDGVTHMAETDVVYRAELSAGVHRIEVAHPELGSRSRSVTVSPGGRVRVEIDLASGS